MSRCLAAQAAAIGATRIETASIAAAGLARQVQGFSVARFTRRPAFFMPPVEVIPAAHRLIESLRDIGYDFSQAVADVIDNSISARASQVDIDITFDGDDSWLRIVDNGRGMNPEELRDAMRYGTRKAYSEVDLGKFGLGLKTASMSQCERLIVASRWNTNRGDVSAYAWDLEHVRKTDRWEILPIERADLPHGIDKLLRDGPGTVVYWQRLERVLGYKHPYGEAARKQLAQLCGDLEAHLRMVFHEFLAGKIRGRKIRMTLNGNALEPWDPYCGTEKNVTPLSAFRAHVEFNGQEGEVTFEPFILPHESDFSSPEAHRAASGPAGWNQQQGFYIYRGGRLIQSGGWSGLRVADEHTKLARIAVRYPRNLDGAFGINVAKQRVRLPPGIRDEVKRFIGPVSKVAREVYDRKQRGHAGAHQSSGAGIPSARLVSKSSALASSAPATPPLRLTKEEWARILLDAAHPSERAAIKRALARMNGDPR